jgi:hypothetical protein
MLPIHLRIEGIMRTRWYEFAVRFVFGGLATVTAGLIAKYWGPSIGGWFLAFPAIFPAAATLVEKHEIERKRRAGIDRTDRGRIAAARDACGSVLGSVGLIAFAITVYELLPRVVTSAALIAGIISWLAVSVFLWRFRRHLHPR